MLKELEEKFEQYENGNLYAEEFWLQISQIEEDLKIIKEIVRENLIERINAKLAPSIFSLAYRKTYDFSNVGIWQLKNGEVSEKKEELKKIENQLKNASTNTPYIDGVTGEEVCGVPFTTTTIIAVKKNNQSLKK